MTIFAIAIVAETFGVAWYRPGAVGGSRLMTVIGLSLAYYDLQSHIGVAQRLPGSRPSGRVKIT